MAFTCTICAKEYEDDSLSEDYVENVCVNCATELDAELDEDNDLDPDEEI